MRSTVAPLTSLTHSTGIRIATENLNIPVSQVRSSEVISLLFYL